MKPKIIYYIFLACIGVLVVGGAGSYYLSHTRFQDKIDRTERLRADIILANEQLQNLNDLEQAYTKVQSLEEKMDRMLPQEKKQSEVAATIYTMIEQAELEGSDLTFESTDGVPDAQTQTIAGDIEGVRVMPVNFTVRGNYRQLQTFLRSIEQQERLMQIQSLGIQRAGGEGVLSFDIQLEVFIAS